MDVQLYVYDLTKGMARMMSQQLLGIQIDAVYHTSLVFDKIEYFFGAGVQTCHPGATHHGRPMEIVNMGITQLPMDTILEYLEGLKTIYTPESYDLFTHNCNNFTNDFGMFLLGRGIPSHITNLPKRVLDTPFGQMLRPQIDASMRSITQAEVPAQNRPSPSLNGASLSTAPSHTGALPSQRTSKANDPYGRVIAVNGLANLDDHLASASDSCVTIFFTSATCAPCRLAYPMFDNLAGEYPRALFAKVDIDEAQDVAMRYQIRATPTFITFSKGNKEDEWAGADPSLLKANVDRLVEKAFPPHPHLRLKVPALQFGSLQPITYARVPPLEKLMAKLGAAANESPFTDLQRFVERRNVDPKEATLPDLQAVSRALQTRLFELPPELRFAAVDLLRCAMIDQRVGGYFAEEAQFSTIRTLIENVNELQECPYNLRLVTIHLACNIFTSALFTKELMQQQNQLASAIVHLVASSLLDASHPTARVAAASLAFNLGIVNYRIRREEAREGLAESEQVALIASLVERLSIEDNSDAVKTILLAVAYLVYCTAEGGETMDLCRAIDAKTTVTDVKVHRELAKEIASLL